MFVKKKDSRNCSQNLNPICLSSSSSTSFEAIANLEGTNLIDDSDLENFDATPVACPNDSESIPVELSTLDLSLVPNPTPILAYDSAAINGDGSCAIPQPAIVVCHEIHHNLSIPSSIGEEHPLPIVHNPPPSSPAPSSIPLESIPKTQIILPTSNVVQIICTTIEPIVDNRGFGHRLGDEVMSKAFTMPLVDGQVSKEFALISDKDWSMKISKPLGRTTNGHGISLILGELLLECLHFQN